MKRQASKWDSTAPTNAQSLSRSQQTLQHRFLRLGAPTALKRRLAMHGSSVSSSRFSSQRARGQTYYSRSPGRFPVLSLGLRCSLAGSDDTGTPACTDVQRCDCDLTSICFQAGSGRLFSVVCRDQAQCGCAAHWECLDLSFGRLEVIPHMVALDGITKTFERSMASKDLNEQRHPVWTSPFSSAVSKSETRFRTRA